MFEPAELMRFMSEYFPTPEDLALPTGKSKSHKERVERLRRLMNQHLVGIGRINDMRAAKKSGLVESESEPREEEPVILDHPPRRRPNQSEAPREDERSPGGDRDNEEEEED